MKKILSFFRKGSKKREIVVRWSQASMGLEADEGFITPESIGLPKSISDELRKMQQRYEQIVPMDYSEPLKKDVEQFNKQGYKVFLKVKKFLDKDKYKVKFLKM